MPISDTCKDEAIYRGNDLVKIIITWMSLVKCQLLRKIIWNHAGLIQFPTLPSHQIKNKVTHKWITLSNPIHFPMFKCMDRIYFCLNVNKSMHLLWTGQLEWDINTYRYLQIIKTVCRVSQRSNVFLSLSNNFFSQWSSLRLIWGETLKIIRKYFIFWGHCFFWFCCFVPWFILLLLLNTSVW